MRKFLLAGVVLGFTVTATANGQAPGRYDGTAFIPMRGQIDGIASVSGDMRRDAETIYFRNLVITFDPRGLAVELRADEVTEPRSGDTMTLTGTVTLRVPASAAR